MKRRGYAPPLFFWLIADSRGDGVRVPGLSPQPACRPHTLMVAKIVLAIQPVRQLHHRVTKPGSRQHRDRTARRQNRIGDRGDQA